MKEIRLMRDWSFSEPSKGPFGKSVKRTVQLPHDMMIEKQQNPAAPRASGFYPGCQGTYEKKFFVPAEWSGERVKVNFDGVYQKASVFLNGSRLYFHPYGYTPFTVDLTEKIRFGEENRLEVTVNNDAVPNCRWYTGAGLFREVKLLHGPAVRIREGGMYLMTDYMEGGTAWVTAEITVDNDGRVPAEGRIAITMRDAEGNEAKAETGAFFLEGQSVWRLRFPVKNAKLWSPETPDIYEVTAVLTAGELRDEAETRFGIREIRVDAENGFRLNGKPYKLYGGCIHHAFSILGAADLDDGTRRLLKAHKDAGYNALRTAHNPPSGRFLDLCDEYGIMVIDEAFDGWHVGKNSHDYGEHFDDWWERDLESYVLRNRNHPSVVLWSIGNEVYERSGGSGGNRLAYELAEKVRSLDRTRPVTAAMCSLWNGLEDSDQRIVDEEKKGEAAGQNETFSYIEQIYSERTEMISAALDVVGYNYMDERYEMDHETFPNRVFVCTESFPIRSVALWEQVRRLPYVIGDFEWTSADYIGEPGIGATFYVDPKEAEDQELLWKLRGYPWKTSFDSDWDICGFERAQLFLRRLVFGTTEETGIFVRPPKNYGKKEIMTRWSWPELYPSWTFPGDEGKPVEIDVYSAGDEVELFKDGLSLGTKKAEEMIARFETVYGPGELRAVSRRNGEILSESIVKTAGEAVALRLTPERKEIPADGESLLFVTVEFVDKDGARVPGLKLPLEASASGDAELIRFGSGNPVSDESYVTGRYTSFDGRALAILRAGTEPGEAELTVKCEGFPEAVLRVTIG